MEKRVFQTERSEYHKAKEAVNKKIGFYIHLAVYICINLFFHILNRVDGGGYWAVYPLVFWGIGLGIHYLNVFDVFGKSEWKKKQILKQIEKQRRRSRQP